MELITFRPIEEKSATPVINDVVKKFHYLVANYSVEIGNYSIVPARTIFGNKSKTKKVIQWNKGLALGMNECVCGFTSTATDIKIIYDNKHYFTNKMSMHKLMYHFEEVRIKDIDVIDSFNIIIPENYNILDDKCPISGEKYKEMFHATLRD